MLGWVVLIVYSLGGCELGYGWGDDRRDDGRRDGEVVVLYNPGS